MKRLLIAMLLLAAALPARAQEFPSRDIRFLCGFAPGGTCDLLTRILAEQLSPIFRVKIVAENRTGASGMIAADTVAKAAPDGHTVVLATMAMHTILPEMPGMRMPCDVVNDLTPVANVQHASGVTHWRRRPFGRSVRQSRTVRVRLYAGRDQAPAPPPALGFAA